MWLYAIKLSSVTLLFSLLMWPVIIRAELANINMRMTATLVANSCTVSTASNNKIVDMGHWPTKQFTEAPYNTPAMPFNIILENCRAITQGVKVTFKGVSDSAVSSLLAVSGAGSAKNIAIAILDKERNRIPPGQPSITYSLTPNVHTQTLTFYAQYVATAMPVTAGKANADATFTIDYP